MFPNRMDPDRARAASERVISRLRQRANDVATGPRSEAKVGEPMSKLTKGKTERAIQGGLTGSLDPAPRIRIDVPLGTSYKEIKERILRQAYEQAGTQLLAAKALGITPETVSRVLSGRDRRKLARPRVPEAAPVNPASAASGSRANEGSGGTPEQAVANHEKVGRPRDRNDGAIPYDYVDAAMNQLIDKAIDGEPV